MSNPVDRGERSLGDLFRQLADDTAALIRQEMALARTELGDRFRALIRDTAIVAVGGLLGLVALMAWVAAAVLGLVHAGVEAWAAAMAMAALLSVVALGLVMTRLSAMRRRGITPVHTVASLKETARWLQNETR